MTSCEMLSSGEAHLTATGRLDAHQAGDLRQRLEEAQEQGATTFYLSMAEVSFMDSAGLAAVVSGLKSARLKEGELYLIDPSPAVRKVLEYTLLDRIMPIRDSLEEARPKQDG